MLAADPEAADLRGGDLLVAEDSASGVVSPVPDGVGRSAIVREKQRAWAARPLRERLAVLRRTRPLLATRCATLAQAISADLKRSEADTLAAEVLPLLAAFCYVEREAANILRTRRIGAWGRPVWLPGVRGEIERAPLGTVLVIGPSNYPLLLPGVQVMQALAAGNAVVWKPGRGGRAVALEVLRAFEEAGLPDGLLAVTDESVAAADEAMRTGVDKVVLTGSAATGRAVLRIAAETLTPVVAELSGSDAVIVLPSADLQAVAEAVAFGLRFNGSATCMAPRRLLLMDATRERVAECVDRLLGELRTVDPVRLPQGKAAELRRLALDAIDGGAMLIAGELPVEGEPMRPLVLVEVQPAMPLAQADVFAPVLSVMEVAGERGLAEAQRLCPLGLTAAIFFGRGERDVARKVARSMDVGTVLLNDVMVATADPRLPFAARRGSGFGSTRGAEGLLEMTAPRVIAEQRGRGRRRFAATGTAHVAMFAGLAALLYAGAARDRWRGARQMVAGASAVKREE